MHVQLLASFTTAAKTQIAKMLNLASRTLQYTKFKWLFTFVYKRTTGLYYRGHLLLDRASKTSNPFVFAKAIAR